MTHEIQPIISGHRLVLVYNLVKDPSEPVPSALPFAQDKKEISSLLSAWERAVVKGNTKAPQALIYNLDHKYADCSLGFSSLKGSDRVKASYFRELCPRAEICFYLASMERMQMGSCEEDMDEHEDEFYYRKRPRYYDEDDEDDEDDGDDEDEDGESDEDDEDEEPLDAHHTIEEVLEQASHLRAWSISMVTYLAKESPSKRTTMGRKIPLRGTPTMRTMKVTLVMLGLLPRIGIAIR